MKKIYSVLCVVILTTMLMASTCFAAGGGTFTVDKTYPEDGQSDTSIDNLCVKIFLNSGASFSKTLKSKKDCFKIKDSKNKEIPFGLEYNEKEHVILVFAYDEKTKNTLHTETGVEGDSNYKATISKSLVDDNGNRFKFDNKFADSNGDYSISFKTQNMSRTMTVNMIMMAVMFIGIFVISSRAAKKNRMTEEDFNKKHEKINPYEEAKRTGKSVEQIVAREDKKREKEAKREAEYLKRQEKLEAAREAELEAERRASYYKVSGPRPIAAAGGKFKSGRKQDDTEK